MRWRPNYDYLLSLPERSIRALGALSGGLLREVGLVALPLSLRRTTLYRTMVDIALQFMIQEVGQVKDVYPEEDRLAENFLIKKTAGHGIELMGILAFHASPIWVLAALADVAGGGRTMIREISEELKQEGLLDKNERFDSMDQVLDGLEKTSSHLAKTLNMPPVDVPGLRKEWSRFREEAARIAPSKLPTVPSLERVWNDLRAAAKAQDRSVVAMSSLLAVSTLAHLPSNVVWLSRAAQSAARRTGKVLGESILYHYTSTLEEISRTGFSAYWAREFRPYLRGAAQQFAADHTSWTERFLARRRT
ncbi:MAG TPA: hypothetical protein VGP79_02590 [Bryobacteraceae bacterium]|nr:hypothetical protein [Bryobacteraceae bacterium]